MELLGNNIETNPPTATLSVSFPEDDGATQLTGSSANVVLNLLTKAGPDVARTMGKSFSITEEQYAEIKAFTDELVADCKTEAKVYNTIFKWVSQNISYTYGTDNEPYPTFINRKAICQGYANLIHVMLHSQGIPVLNVNGMLNPVGGHAWNYAYVNKRWFVCDATNNGSFSMLNPSSYSHLDPMFIDADLFEDEQFVFNFSERKLNLRKVKSCDDLFVVPFSAGGFRVTSFNPDEELPNNVREIYLGKNITCLGENNIGLNRYAPTVEAVHIDENNKVLTEYAKAVYYKNGNNYSLCYMPAAISIIECPPMEIIGKNFLASHDHVEEVIIAPGTKKLEAYAFERCPKLRIAYVPEETEIDSKAFYEVHPDLQIVRGDYTGISDIHM